MTSDPSTVTVYIILIIILIALNGIIVLSNTALESLSRNKIKNMSTDEENIKQTRLMELLDKPYRYQYANRILNYIFTGTALVLSVLQLPYHDAIILAGFIFVTVVLGELLPRRVAMQHSESIAISLVNLQRVICGIMTPFVWIFLLVTDLFLKLFRQETNMEDESFSEEEVMSMLEVGQETGVIKEEGKKMINSIFAFDDELAYEIMTPRTDVFYIDINDPTEEYIDELMELRYSRIPVCENETDNIIGILHIKDYLIKAREDGFENVDIRSILRKPCFVPETKNIDALFFELQMSKQHIAILIDEYGGFSGIVTLEDIIEEVMGDIDDEYDEETSSIEQIDENTYVFDGNLSLDDLDEELGLSLESDNSETVGGFLIDILGEIPDELELEDIFERAVEFEKYTFKILSVKEHRIERVKLCIAPNDSNDNASDDE
ncbi:MAG: hemolysin family protein [Anaerovoracaceae bacterium]